ncbi:MAG: SLC13 family permease [Thermoplasmatota archaeon]
MDRENIKKIKIIISTFLIAFLITKFPFPPEFTHDGKIMIAIAFTAAIFWITECIPIPVTALLIILLQGLFQIQPFHEVFAYIATPVNTLLIAGFIIAGSLKKYDLDRRIGLRIIVAMGEKTNQLILGLMIGTAFLSMWISNTASTAIMLPIGIGMIKKINDNPKDSNVGKAMVIGIAFAANIGGMGTPVGTPAIPITIAFLDSMADIGVTFLGWMVRAVPLVIILVPIAWKLLTTIYEPKIKIIEGGTESVKRELEKMGELTVKQKHVLILFSLAVFLWISDSFLSLVEGWLYIASIAIAIMFVLPGVGVLTWKEASDEIGWGVLILVGGGLALGSGLQKTGVISIIAGHMHTLVVNADLVLVIAVVSFVTAFSITLFSSLTATSSTFVPVAITLAYRLNVSPLLLGAVAGLSSCLAFLLPANTAPNAVVYSSGFFKTYEMTKAGLILTALSVIVVIILGALYWSPFLS